MSVVVAPPIQFKRSWPPPLDPRDPVGLCGLIFNVAGDGSGGSITVNCIVPPDRVEDRIFVVKAVTMRATADPGQGHVICNLDEPNFQLEAAGPVTLVHAFDFNVEATLGTFNGGAADAPNWPESFRSLLFQSKNSTQDYNALQLVYGTNTNAATYLNALWGYWWSQEVLNVAGGPRVPA